MSTKETVEGAFAEAWDHPYNLSRAMARFECGYLFNILELTRWDRAKASRMLGIDPQLLASKIRAYRLSPEDRPLPE